MIDRILALFEERGYRFVPLDQAESDPAYLAPDTFVTKFGMMWGYRWAAGREIKYDGTLEPEPRAWIAKYQ